MKDKSIDQQYKDKLYRAYAGKNPKLFLSLQIHRLFQDVDSDGYVFFMANLVEDVHILVGKNMPALCDGIADEILRHLETANEPTTAGNAAKG